MEIYDTPSVTVTNCMFTNNTSNGIGNIRNSGNAGALSIGFNETFNTASSPQILIQDSTFVNNTATIIGNCRSVSTVLFSKIYSQRGGAVAGYFAAAGLQLEITIQGCSFTNNTAKDSGGGVYINLSGGDGASTSVTFTNNRFVGNCAVDGGAIETTFDSPESVMHPSHLVVENCTFEENEGQFGGAIKAVQINAQGNLNHVRVERCNFTENMADVGAAMHLQSLAAELFVHMDMDRIVVEDW